MTDSELIDKAGGTHAVAVLCGTSDAVVTNWKSRGIPDGWRKFLALSRADVFSEKSNAA